MAHSRRQFLRVSVLGLGGVTVASLLAACGGASRPAGKPLSRQAGREQAGRGREAGGAGRCRRRDQPHRPLPPSLPMRPSRPSAKPAPRPAFAGGGSLKLLMRSHFVPA